MGYYIFEIKLYIYICKTTYRKIRNILIEKIQMLQFYYMKSRTGKVNHADGNQISSLGGNRGGKTAKTQKGTLLSDRNIIYPDGMVVT